MALRDGTGAQAQARDVIVSFGGLLLYLTC